VQLLLFESVLAIAASMMSGADTAILHDREKALSDSEESRTGSIAHLSSTTAFTEGAGALMGGALGSADLTGLAQVGVSWVCLVLARALVGPPFRESKCAESLRGFKAICTHRMKGDKVLRQTSLAIPLHNLSTFLVAWLQGLMGIAVCFILFSAGVSSR